MTNTNRMRVAAVLLLLGTLVLYLCVIDPLTWKTGARKDSIRMLAAAQTTNELAQAVGELGLFLSFPDQSWMAIRYRDRHAGGVFSVAVACDSGAGWSFSERHFCGYLSAYPKIAGMHQACQEAVAAGRLTNAPNLLLGFEDIHALAMSPDLPSARTNLLKMGFQRLQAQP